VLAANVVAALGRHIPGLSRNLVAIDVLTPDDARERFGVDDAFGGRVTAERLLAGWRERLATPVAGLVICGASADPVGAVSGRSGRLAAKFACKTGGRL
jgi:phytoene dehydrogenase-like protein